MSIVNTAPITAALMALVAGATARPVGDARLPVGDPPFVVVEPLPSGETWGPDYVAPQAAAVLSYQVTTVAIARGDAEVFADVVRHAILDRDADGAFVVPLSAVGVTVLDRELASYGGVITDRGVYNIADTYQIHVTRS